jgi:hypothetical protein
MHRARFASHRRILGILTLLLAASAPPARAADNPYLWQPKTRSVSVFKNGFGFFMGDAEVSLREGWCTAADIPPATFGTLAIYSHGADETVDVVGSGPGEVVEFDGRDAPADAKSKLARLESCKQLKVALTYSHAAGPDRTAAGKLVSVGPEYVVLEGDGNSFAVPAMAVKKLQMLDLPLRVHVTTDAQKAPERAKVGMAYLRQGVAWIPAYTLRVLDEETAELTLRGTLVNEAEDIVHADVNFVVGVPHFLHSGYMEPIAVGRVIRTIGAAVAPGELQSQIMSRAAIANNSIRQNQFDGRGREGPDGIVERQAVQDGGNALAAAGNVPVMETPGGSDFTVYTKKDLTVRRGEKAIVTLFVKKIRYSNLYRWSPPGQPEHFLSLQNDNTTALTTGPCLAMSKDQPLSEDLLKYTPKGGRAEVPVTAAVNVASDRSESETDRKFKAHSPSKDVFLDLVTLKGELKVRNFEARPVDMIIDVAVPGKPLSASDAAATSIDPDKLSLLNRQGDIRWRLKLQPGESKTLTYLYERYVPAN